MSTPLSQTVVAHGRLNASFFQPDNQVGDWQRWNVQFPTPFAVDGVRIVAMASSDGVDAGLGTTAAVPVITQVSRSGFSLAARNSDCARGSAGMHWIAVLERPGQPAPTPVDVRTGILQSRGFAPDCSAGDWNSWAYTIGRPLPGAPTVVGSALRERGDVTLRSTVLGAFVSDAYLVESTSAPVGVLMSGTPQMIALSARNGGGWSGRSAMNFVAIADLPKNETPDAALVVDSGATGVVEVPPTGGSSPVRLDVNFSLPFSTPPIVLITACDQGLPIGETPVAAVGAAHGVTTHGFTLEAMSTDSAVGRTSFYWVAIGCGISCGAGRADKTGKAPDTPPVTPPFTPPLTPTTPPLTPTTPPRTPPLTPVKSS